MSDEPINGRVSQRDLYEQINRLDAKMEHSFELLDRKLDRYVERHADQDHRPLAALAAQTRLLSAMTILAVPVLIAIVELALR